MNQYKGKLIVHTGSMFSGKTKGLETDILRFQIANMKTQVFKPSNDDRYAATEICTHDGIKMCATVLDKDVTTLEFLSNIRRDTQVIGIDEVQFFQELTMIHSIEMLLENGITVVVAGLDIDYLGLPFKAMSHLMSIAEYVNKHHAVCIECGNDAWVSHRKSNESSTIVVGGTEKYMPLCRSCYYKKIRHNEMGA